MVGRNRFAFGFFKWARLSVGPCTKDGLLPRATKHKHIDGTAAVSSSALTPLAAWPHMSVTAMACLAGPAKYKGGPRAGPCHSWKAEWAVGRTHQKKQWRPRQLGIRHDVFFTEMPLYIWLQYFGDLLSLSAPSVLPSCNLKTTWDLSPHVPCG